MPSLNSTFAFAYPWALAAPIILFFIFLLRRPASKAVTIPSITPFDGAPRSLRVLLYRPVRLVLIYTFIGSLTIVAARPQLITYIDASAERRNLVLAVDVSRSMGAMDFSSIANRISRLTAVKQVVAEFVRSRPEDRLSLVVFGSRAFVQCPLTLDHDLLLRLVDRLDIGIAGDGTAIGDGLGLSLKRISEVPAASSSVILITDGVNGGGKLDPFDVAQVAKQMGVKIHTIAIGSSGDLVRAGQGAGIILGQVQSVAVDEAALQKIASVTGGSHFNAKNIEALKTVYAEIDKLEKSKRDEAPQQLIGELFYPFLILALVAYSIYLLAFDSIFRRLP